MAPLACGHVARRVVAGSLLALLCAPALLACSSDGSVARPERTSSSGPAPSDRPSRASAAPAESVAPSPRGSDPPGAAPRPSVAPPASAGPPRASAEPPPASAEPPRSEAAAAPSPSPTSSPAVAAVVPVAPVAATSEDSNPWPWILLGAVVLAGIFLFAFMRRRNSEQRLETWRRSTRPAVDAAHLARDLLPALGRNITDLGHWTDV